MNLKNAITHYHQLRATAQEANAQFAYGKVLICIENARTTTEALSYLHDEVSNATSTQRREIYIDAIFAMHKEN
jgi:hypothetical protein